LRRLLILTLLSTAAVAAENPPPQAQQNQQPPQGGAGGDGGSKPKAASMIIEEESTANEPPPPAPVGEEKRIIGDVIRQNSDVIQDCYSRRLQDRPTLQGRLIVRFDIGPNGKVIGATADGIQDRDLIICVVKAVRLWEFTKPASGGKLRVAYPFKFEPQPSR
jgi:outer membrane biosynthesis protein TonB